MKRIAILIPHFGPWPEWIDFFIESCRSNRSIDWIIFSDAEAPPNRAANVKHVRIDFPAYVDIVSNKLDIRIEVGVPYKLCDIRPALPFVHRDLVEQYDFVGFGDLDVIYGDIRSFYDDEVLERYDLLSSHADRVSGHFCLMRNTPAVTCAFQEARGWKEAASRPEYLNFDERGFYNYFMGLERRWLPSRRTQHRCFFREAYSTPGAASDMRWSWKDGRLTNEFYPQQSFMYLHFMSWHSDRWYHAQPDVPAGTRAPWSLLDVIVQMDWRDARSNGFSVSRGGIRPLVQPE